jgi:hypothetical protein
MLEESNNERQGKRKKCKNEVLNVNQSQITVARVSDPTDCVVCGIRGYFFSNRHGNNI